MPAPLRKRSPLVQSVVRAIRLLEVLDRMRSDNASLGELARRAGIKPPTAHNLLHTLAVMGYVERSPDGRGYRLGRKARDLGRLRFGVQALISAARAPIERLRRRLGETVILAVFRDGARHTILSAESPHALRVGAETGMDRRFYDTASGRVLLSMLSAAELKTVIEACGPPGDAWPEVDGPESLHAALADIRAAGGASVEHRETGIHAVAVPVPLPDEPFPAALGVYYPAIRSPAGGIGTLCRALRETAEEIAVEMGRPLPAGGEPERETEMEMRTL